MKERASLPDSEGVAAENAENRKSTRYGTGLNGVSCVPFGTELWGRMGHSANAMLERLLQQFSEHTGAPKGLAKQRWRAELGCALYRAMAATVQQAMGHSPPQVMHDPQDVPCSAHEPDSEAE